MSGEAREALDAAAARLEQVAAALATAPAQELEALVEEALTLSTQIAQRLPAALDPSIGERGSGPGEGA